MSFCKISFDLHCEKGHPTYRVYLNDELFTERTFVYHGNFLREHLQIDAPVGNYQIHIERTTPGKLSIRNTKATLGRVKIIDSQTFRILE